MRNCCWMASALSTTFPSRWWFQLPTQSWAVQSCFLLNMAWKWTAGITVKSCWSNRRWQVMRRIAGDVSVLQQDSAPLRPHTGHKRLSSSSRHRRTVLIWTQSTTESGVWCRSVFTRLLSETSVSWNSVSSTHRLTVKSVSFQSHPTIYKRNMHPLRLVCSFSDDKVITSKPYMKT